MLKGINPLLGPDLLHCLRSMGHGDELAIVDGNYPADNHAKRLIRCDGHNVPDVLKAILSVFPIDNTENSISHAINVLYPDSRDQIHNEMVSVVSKQGIESEVTSQMPDVFYNRVKSCFAVIATSESALYGNIILRKGVIENQKIKIVSL
ncbi:RbsD/FucU domain-containing protein [bacterium]|nr:RbsD/FucU domain-containing protein [bacterium]